MRQATALAIKLLFTSAIYATVLPLLGNTLITHALIMAAVTAMLLWMVGDLVVLPMFGNVAATAIDGIGALLMLPAIALQIGSVTMPPSIWVAAALLTGAEYVFHRWLLGSEALS